MLQMTVDQDNTINMSRLEMILASGIFNEWENRNPDKQLSLIFVVDPAVYKQV
jgi:hypothetical protein